MKTGRQMVDDGLKRGCRLWAVDHDGLEKSDARPGQKNNEESSR